jgi:hypothetical protein
MTTTHPSLPTDSDAPAPVHLSDSRGLTAVGAVTVALGFGCAGGLIDVLTGEGLRATFAILFVAGCALAAYRVHREDLLAAVVIPPLAYVAVALAANLGTHTTIGGSFVKQQVLELMTALVTKAPVLLVATALAACIALGRRLAFRVRS